MQLIKKLKKIKKRKEKNLCGPKLSLKKIKNMI